MKVSVVDAEAMRQECTRLSAIVSAGTAQDDRIRDLVAQAAQQDANLVQLARVKAAQEVKIAELERALNDKRVALQKAESDRECLATHNDVMNSTFGYMER
jgi:malonyl CoA-acyl carrier protein transacylase